MSRQVRAGIGGVVLLIAGIAGGILGASYLQHLPPSAAADLFYANALRDTPLLEVSIGSTTIEVEYGTTTSKEGLSLSEGDRVRALRLAYDRTLAQNDPLISLAGTDPATLLSATDELASVVPGLVALQKDPEAVRAIQTSLFPLNFLRSAARLEAARLAFIASGSDRDSAVYHAALIAAETAYSEDLNRYKSAFLNMVPGQTAQFGLSGGRVASRASELRALESLQKSAAEIKNKITLRDRCLSGAVADCRPEELALPAVDVPPFSNLKGDALARVREVVQLLYDASRPDTGQSKAPHVSLSLFLPSTVSATSPPTPDLPPIPFELEGSSCIVSPSAERLFIMRNQKSLSGATYQALTYVGDVMMIPASHFPSIPYFQYYASHDVEYVPYWPTSTYSCLTLQKDTSLAVAMYSVVKVIAKNPFSAYATSSNRAALRSLEQPFETEPVVSQSKAAAYLAAVRTFLNQKPNISADAGRTYAALALSMDDNSAGLAEVVQRLAVETKTNILYSHSEYPVELGALYLFFTRSSIFSLLMTDNPSLVTYQASPYEENLLPASKQPFVTYFGMLPTVPKEKLLHDIRFEVLHEQGPMIH